MDLRRAETVEPTPRQEGNATTFKCEGCGGTLSYTPGTQHLACPYCAHNCAITASEDEVSELDFEEHLQHAAEEAGLEEHLTVTCDGCGARNDLQPNVTAGSCPFCGSPLVAQHVSEKRFQPRSLLPFKTPLDEAKALFKKWIASRWFAPRAFHRDVRPDKLDGVYCPFWTYDAETRTRYRGERGDYYYVTQSYKVMVDGKEQTRTRRERRTRWSHAAGNVKNLFDDILVRASRGLPETLAANLGPWDLHQLCAYQPEFLSGFKVESYSIGLEDGFADAKAQMEPVIRQTIRQAIGGDEQRIQNTSTGYKEITFKHILLPVWISAYRYKGKTYRFLVNANTGQIQGERPYSWIKITLLCVAIAAAAAALLLYVYQ
ncbi:MAG: hypothetical protein PHO37_17275 [Kiritimatiellae bacterium]|nr:hypothetical protein [Kiritimatiellia bacterium]